ncbi:MAG: tetratricopeptide repeat protein [Candidatus Aminicenantes bacterium]|nr:tetratricopeptide repeat protein [Candidatus Aminicenantes bacterium]
MESQFLIHFRDYFLGRLEESLAGYLALRKIGESYDSVYLVTGVDWISGFIYCDLGRFEQAREAFLAYFENNKPGSPAKQNAHTAQYAFILGWADLKQGNLEAARSRLEDIKPLLPTLNQKDLNDMTLWYQLLDAEIALAEDSPEKAVAAAERLQLMDFRGMSTPDLLFYNIPFLKDVLARAYWKKGELDKAIAEYRKLMIVDPRNRIRYLIHPLYHYRLGRVLGEKGDMTGAAGEYRKFLEYWKDADPGLPEVEDARKRLAGLMGS